MNSKSGLPPTGIISHRFASSSLPSSYDAATHSCDCVISAGAAVNRAFGIEKLRVDSKSVDLSRVESGACMLLDSHSQGSVIDAVLGRIDSAWIKSGELWGRIIFAQTPAGRQAEGMVSRGELKGVSAGYVISEWECSESSSGKVLDPDTSPRWNDDLTFTAVRWQLLEASLVGVPADADSAVRSFGGVAGHDDGVTDIRVRMQARQRMHERAQAMIGKYHEN
jgi:Caudovirus prohead serine protease